jgi:hypothetical protein
LKEIISSSSNIIIKVYKNEELCAGSKNEVVDAIKKFYEAANVEKI